MNLSVACVSFQHPEFQREWAGKYNMPLIGKACGRLRIKLEYAICSHCLYLLHFEFFSCRRVVESSRAHITLSLNLEAKFSSFSVGVWTSEPNLLLLEVIIYHELIRPPLKKHWHSSQISDRTEIPGWTRLYMWKTVYCTLKIAEWLSDAAPYSFKGCHAHSMKLHVRWSYLQLLVESRAADLDNFMAPHLPPSLLRFQFSSLILSLSFFLELNLILRGFVPIFCSRNNLSPSVQM